MNVKRLFVLLMVCLAVFSCGGGGGGGSEPQTAPSAPQNVVATSGNTEVCLTWEDVGGATAYNIYWSTASGVHKQTGTKISNVSGPYYHADLTNDVPYYYVVTAVNAYGESVESAEVSAIPSPLNPPLPPSNVATLVGDRKVIIRWSPRDAEGIVASYNIYWSMQSGVTKENGTKISDAANPYTHSGLANGVTYYYVVSGVNEYGEGRASEEVSATPDQGNVPSAPTGLAVEAGNHQAVVKWTAAAGATSYNLYWSTSSDVTSGNGTKISGVTSPYTHTGLAYDTTYYYVLTAENGYGESEDSERASVTIPNYLEDVCVAMGDSITVGKTYVDYENSYVPRLAAALGKTVYNEGVDKALSSYGAAVVDNILAYYNPKYITIYYGTNDSGFYDNGWIVENLRYIVQRAKANGTIPVVATVGPFFGDWEWKKPTVIELNQLIRQMAADEGIACADLEAALDWNSGYISEDGMHPNSAGHTLIANAFNNALH